MASSASTSPQQLDEPTGSSEYARAAEECAFQKRSRRRRRWTCGFGSILVCLLVIGAVAYRAGQQALRNLQGYIAPTLQQMLHREVRIDSARVSGNRLIIEGLAIADGPTLRSGTLLRARQAVITVSIWDALTRRSTPLAALGSLRIESPELTLVRRASGEWNISDLFRHGNGNLKDFHGRVEMVSGRVTISDYASSTQASPAVEDLHGISLTLDAARSPRFAVAFSADGGGSYLRRLALSGWGHMDGTAYDLRAEVGGADLPYWQHYYHIATKLPARSGEVSLQLTATKQAGHAMHLSGVATSPHLVMAPNVLRGTLVATPLVVRVNDDRFEIDARGQAAGIPITVTGTVIDHPTGSVMDLKVNAPRVLAAQAQRAISGWPELPGVTWDAPFSLDGRISGPARTWRVDVSALAPALRAQGVPVTDVHLNGSYDYNTNRIVIGRAQAQVAGGSIEARGSVDRSQHPAQLAISGKAAGIDLAALPFLPDVEKHGTASADFRAQGPLDHVGATVSLATSDVTLAQARFGRIGAVLSLRPGASPVVRVDASGMRFADGRTAMPLPDRAAAALELLPGRVRIANASLSVDGQPVRVSGSAGFDGSLDVQLSAGHVPVALLGELAGVYGAAGSAVLDAHVTGTTSRPRAAGRITVAQGRYQKNTLDRLTASFEGDPTHEGTVQFDLSGLRAGALAVSKASGQVAMHSGDFILSKVVAETSRGHLLAEGKIARDGALDVAVNASGLDLASLARAAGLDTAGQDPVTGTATFSGRVTGRRQSPAAAGTFVARQGTVHGIPFDDLRGSVHASPAGVTLDQVALRRGGSLLALTGKIDAQHAKAMVIDAQVHAQSVDLAEIARTSALKEPIAGRANADLTVKGTLPNVAVAGHFDVDGAQAVGSTLGHVSGDLTSSGDRTEIRKLTAVDGGAQIALSGTYGPAGRLDLRVEGTQVPLERLDHFTGAYAQMAGRADVNGSVSGSTAHPEVHLNLQTGPVTLAGQSFGALAGQVEYADDEVRVTGLNLSHDGGQYRVERITFRPSDEALSLRVTTRNADVAQLVALARGIKMPDSALGRRLRAQLAALPSPLSGHLTADISVEGRLSAPSTTAQFTLSDAAVGAAKVQTLGGNLAWSPDSFALRSGVLSAPGVDLKGDVAQAANGRLEAHVRLGASRLEAIRALAQSLPQVAVINEVAAGANGQPAGGWQVALRGLPNPFSGEVSGSIDLAGPANALDGTATLALRGARLGEAQLAETSASARWDRGSLALKDLVVRANGVDLRGGVTRQADGALDLNLRSAGTDMAAARDLTRAVGAVAAAYRRRPVLPQSVSELLASLPDPLAGQVTGTIALSGKPGALSGSVDTEAKGIRFGDLQMPALIARGTLSPGSWDFPTLSLTGQGYSLGGSLRVGPNNQLNANFTTGALRLEDVRQVIAGATVLDRYPTGKELRARVAALPAPFAGKASGSVRLAGSLADPLTDVQFTATDLVLGDQSVPSLTANVGMRGQVVAIRTLNAQANGGNLGLTGSVDLHGPINLTATGRNFALAAFKPLLPSQPDLAGHLDLDATVDGTLDNPRAQIQASVSDAKINGLNVSSIRTGVVRVENGRIDLGQVQVASDQLSGVLSGTLPFRTRPLAIPADQPIHLSVAVPQHDLAMLAKLTPAVQSATGTAQAKIEIGGTLRDPSLNGDITVQGGRVKLAALDEAIVGLEARVRLDGPWIVVDNLAGQSEHGGKLVAAGRLPLWGTGTEPSSLQLQIDQFPIAAQDVGGIKGARFTTAASGRVQLGGTLQKPLLSGKLTLAQAQVTIPAELVRLAKPQPFPINPALQLDVETVGASVRRGRTLNAVVDGGAAIRGTLNNPTVGGRLTVEKGDVHYVAVNFRLQPGGTISFNYLPPNDVAARLDVKALTRVRATPPTAAPGSTERRSYDVTLHVTGALPDVNVAVTSDPPDLTQYRLLGILAHTDQFDALAKGKDPNSILGQQVASILSGAVLPQVFEPIESGLAQVLGLDEVNFDYGPDRPLSFDARKEVLPRVFLSYNRDMGQAQYPDGHEQWSVTYRVFQQLYVGWRRDTAAEKQRLVLEGTFRF